MRSIRRNAAYNVAGAVVPLTVSLITIPIYIETIGAARYGVLAIVWLMVGYFGVFDLGIGRAVAQRVAAQRNEPVSNRADTYWTAVAVNLILGLIGAVIIFFVSQYAFTQLFDFDEISENELLAIVPWLAVALPIATVSSVMSGALQGMASFLALNLVTTVGSVLFQLLPLLVALYIKPTLDVLLIAAIIPRFLTLLAFHLIFYKHIAERGLIRFSRKVAKELIAFGGWVTVSSVIGPLLVASDRFLIGIVSGAKAVTFYTVPFQLGARSSIISNALTSAIFPKLAGVSAYDARVICRRSTRIILSLTTPIFGAGILLVRPFFAAWMSPEFSEQTTLVAQLLILAFWINGIAKVSFVYLQARERPDVIAKCHVAELAPYLAFLYLGLSYWGIAGAALVFFLRTLADLMLLAWFSKTLRFTLSIAVLPFFYLSASILLECLLVPYDFYWIVGVPVYVLLGTMISCVLAPQEIRIILTSVSRLIPRVVSN